MRVNIIKKTVLALLMLVFMISAALLGVSAISVKAASEAGYDALPTEFGDKVGEIINVASGENNGYYQNYQGGYVKLESAADGAAHLKHIGGKNISVNGTASGSATIRDYILTLDAFTVTDSMELSVEFIYGPGFDAATELKIEAAFKEKFTVLYNGADGTAGTADDYICGVPYTTIGGYGDKEKATQIAINFRYGDSVALPDAGKGGNVNCTALLYNVLSEQIFVLNDAKFFEMYANKNRELGTAVSDVMTGVSFTGSTATLGTSYNETNRTVQIFEKGLLFVTDLGTVEIADGVIIKAGEKTYEVAPIIKDQDIMAKVSVKEEDKDVLKTAMIDINGTWHPLKTAWTAEIQGALTAYFNYLPGCVEVVYDDEYKPTSVMVYSGYNYVKTANGAFEKKMLNVEVMAHQESLFFQNVNKNAVELYKSAVGEEKGTEANLKKLFVDAYKDLAGDGYAPGYRCSDLETWGSFIKIDFRFSDSNTGFDPAGEISYNGAGKFDFGRERMTTFVYSPVKDKVFAVYDEFFSVFKNDTSEGVGRDAIGSPISKVMKNKTISGKTYEKVQVFERGYVYTKGARAYAVVGVTSKDDAFNEFIGVLAPSTPDRYGIALPDGTVVDGNATYINYTFGAVKATYNSAIQIYKYDYFPGRNFDYADGKKVKMLSYDKFIGENGEKLSKHANIADEEWNTNYLPKIVAKYKAMNERGIFVGFPEGQFGAWNDTQAMQFIVGDSSSNVFGTSRPNVSALIYNPDKKEFHLVANQFMEAWAGLIVSNNYYRVLKYPTSDAFKLAGNDVIVFQTFKGSISGHDALIVAPTTQNIVAVYTSNMTAQKYLDTLNALDFPNYDDGVIGKDDVAGTEAMYIPGLAPWIWAIIGVSIALVIGGGVAALLIIKKKKKA